MNDKNIAISGFILLLIALLLLLMVGTKEYIINEYVINSSSHNSTKNNIYSESFDSEIKKLNINNKEDISINLPDEILKENKGFEGSKASEDFNIDRDISTDTKKDDISYEEMLDSLEYELEKKNIDNNLNLKPTKPVIEGSNVKLDIKEVQTDSGNIAVIDYELNAAYYDTSLVSINMVDNNNNIVETHSIDTSGKGVVNLNSVPGEIQVKEANKIVYSQTYTPNPNTILNGEIQNISYNLGASSTISYEVNGTPEELNDTYISVINKNGIEIKKEKNLNASGIVNVKYKGEYEARLYYKDNLLDTAHFDGGTSTFVKAKILGTEESYSMNIYDKPSYKINYKLISAQEELPYINIEVYSLDGVLQQEISGLTLGHSISEEVTYSESAILKINYAGYTLSSYEYIAPENTSATIDFIEEVDENRFLIHYTFKGSDIQAKNTKMYIENNGSGQMILETLAVGEHEAYVEYNDNFKVIIKNGKNILAIKEYIHPLNNNISENIKSSI